MKNANLYVNPWDAPEKKHALDTAFQGIPKYESEIFPTRKAKRSEVPPMYRKSITKMILDGILLAVLALSMLNCILFFANIL